MASRKSCVLRYMFSFVLRAPWMQMARSFVILPDSMQSTHAFSRAVANRASSGVLSSFARCSSPRVQAKMEATGLVDVGRPFWCSR
uniref:Putative secreted protein n=1 Tax=Anopheles darlingi TaxID=43151 RepID=A0A2M4D470_ANODA